MGKLGQGYPEGMEYLKLAFNTLSPAYLDVCLALSGAPAIDLEKKFSYAELGAGFGISIAGWAAQYPHAEFHAVDYNTDQCAWTQKLADMAKLDNLFVHACSVGQSLAMPLPLFDFIVLHGIYSWVDDDVRAQIKTFIARFLKPGGCVYISYNAMPGFKDVEPMRHFVGQFIKKEQADAPVQAMYNAIGVLKEMRAADAPFFLNSPQAGVRLDNWLTDDPRYLTAELLAGQHKAYHFGTLQEEFAAMGLVFAGPAGIDAHVASRSLPAALANMVEQAGSPTAQETLKDMFYNTAFRSDLFFRPGAGFSGGRDTDVSSGEVFLENTSFGLAYVRKPLPEQAVRHNFQASLKKEVFPLLQAAMTHTALTLRQLTDALDRSRAEVLDALCTLMALDWVHPGPPQGRDASVDAAVSERVVRFNVSLQAMAGEDSIMPLLSARSGWIDHREQLEHLCIMARLRKEPVENFLLDILLEGRVGEGAEKERSDLKKSIGIYLRRFGADIDAFIKRHGLEQGPE